MLRAEQNRKRILEDPVARTLIRLTLPMILGMISMVGYNLIDTYFVGQLGKEQLAALSFTFPVVLFVNSLALGVGMGASAVISRAVGSQDYEQVRRLAFDSLALGILIVAIGASTGLLTIRPLFGLLGAKGIILDYITEYMSFWYVGMLFVVVPMVGNNIIRATGNAKAPGTLMVLGAVVNLIMDPLLIFGAGPIPALGIKGAALATIIGRLSTFVFSMYLLIFQEKLLTFTLPRLSELLHSWKEILHIGIPNAMTKMIIPLGNGLITRIIAGYGAGAVAGYGVASRIEFFSLAALNALSSVLGPFIGQNLGAGQLARVKAAFRYSGIFSFAVSGTLFLVYLIFADSIAALFNTDQDVVRSASLYLRIVSLTYGAQGFMLAVSAGLNVMKKPFHAAGLSLTEIFCFSVPLALLGSHLFGIPGIFAAIAASYTFTGIISLLTLKRVLRGCC